MKYTPGTPAEVPEELQSPFKSMQRELEKVQEAFNEQDFVQLAVTRAPPAKPRAGMVVYADAAVWNPGAGTGIYGFHSGVWNRLG